SRSESSRSESSRSGPPRSGPERSASEDGEEGGGRSRRRRRNRSKNKDRQGERPEGDSGGRSEVEADAVPAMGTGMFILDKGNVSVLRQKETGYLSSKKDIYVSKNLVQKHKLRDGMMITGPVRRGYKHKLELGSVEEVDGHPPKHWDKKPTFQNLTSVDPDFHYAVGDVTDNVSMRVVDLISPIGRGQRGLLVAPPRTGKTTIMREFAAGIEKGYPDVHLMVLLIDERPEEATEWRRSVEHGEVFVSTADETSKHHIQVAEVVWKRAMRMVEMGEDVILLLDSITRLARAYNNNAGPGKTMSGGLDSRAMERPRKIFGSARNTVEAGSLTILGTTLVETGSRLDQLVFEEFKGTGNMELMLNRKLSDRRIFPAIDIEKSGTRKEEKLVGMKRLKQIHILRRVLARMHFAEAAELLISRLMDVEKTTDFLDRFSIDPED
ncbi:transcription termination factor Rho, partial [Planctomycetota bacterium]|nr:transcription termination factor Rho [Planctomycetota bacterium]